MNIYLDPKLLKSKALDIDVCREYKQSKKYNKNLDFAIKP